MKPLEEIIEKLPENIRLPIYEAFQVLKEDIIHKELVGIKEIIKELVGVQKKLEERISNLERIVTELAEAQKRTEERINELAEAQKKTEQRVYELAEAIKKTEEELGKLIGEHRKTREELGGLSHAFGYVLEDRAIRWLPEILKREYNIEVIGKLKREYIFIKGEYLEVNIYGKVKKDGKEYVLIGEAKSKLSKKLIDKFIIKCEKISKESIKILVSYIFTPEIEKYAKEKEIILIPSYELMV
ncbi:MAG: chordopoxvirus fusion protein [Candidatus Hydrothermales bacterium]